MQHKTILVATDFSPASESAVQYASVLARESGATLLIVHVEEFPLSYPGGEMYVVHPDAPNPVLRQMLEEVVPPGGNVRFEHHLLMGVAANELLRLAHERQVDLIVMGTHGRTGLRRMLMGSVAEAVTRRAECPVLSVKQSSPKPAANPAPTEKSG